MTPARVVWIKKIIPVAIALALSGCVHTKTRTCEFRQVYPIYSSCDRSIYAGGFKSTEWFSFIWGGCCL